MVWFSVMFSSFWCIINCCFYGKLLNSKICSYSMIPWAHIWYRNYKFNLLAFNPFVIFSYPLRGFFRHSDIYIYISKGESPSPVSFLVNKLYSLAHLIPSTINNNQKPRILKLYMWRNCMLFFFIQYIVSGLVFLVQRWNSWKYNFLEVSGHNLEFSSLIYCFVWNFEAMYVVYSFCRVFLLSIHF